MQARFDYPAKKVPMVSVHIRHGDKVKESQSNFYDVPCYVKVSTVTFHSHAFPLDLMCIRELETDDS